MLYQADELKIESTLSSTHLTVRWFGRSDGREPRRTLEPVLAAVTSQFCSAREVDLDFRSLEYMNSSTIRVILTLVQQASGAVAQVRVLYDGSKNWQRLSFKVIEAVMACHGNVELRT